MSQLRASLLVRGLSTQQRPPITLYRPPINFDVKKTNSYDEIVVEFLDGIDESMALVYYPTNNDPFLSTDIEMKSTIKCVALVGHIITIKNLAPNTIYTFCALYNDLNPMITPFQCKSVMTIQGSPWIYREQKTIIITSFTLILLLVLIAGVLLTYYLIRRVPTLIKGSKRVVMVNNRAKEVMILPSHSNSVSSSPSYRKESAIHINTIEPPTYLTPLPRQSIENR
jgi:hypothetical protein